MMWVLARVLILLSSSLDKALASAPNRRIAKITCAQTAVVTGIVLFVSITLCFDFGVDADFMPSFF